MGKAYPVWEAQVALNDDKLAYEGPSTLLEQDKIKSHLIIIHIKSNHVHASKTRGGTAARPLLYERFYR